ncbi:NAD(P)-dependent oxidoreductase [Paenibacillus hexagrammi]|uniref:NAD(P)-dependent oxidoreductase n=1 Tax=Paenibacillus hexagrammi TaxID=2908839 RepID=A0ABY3SFX9_9BACL|nr:NAD(P)-dependent oxidoreductase [Paenibacillus sp. YPD9-1]UJF32086.1 NAD(P)-dependent oxidoreductase [Paenibacillus sp. YPD9-1]
MQKHRIGLVGTGFIARGLLLLLSSMPDMEVTAVLTRRKLNECTEVPLPHVLTNSIQELLAKSDLIVECSGDVIHATGVIAKAMEAALPVVTMDAELQVTTGSFFVSKGYITEAEGDQPGCLAALKANVESMGFKPLVYGNIKGFLNLNPPLEDMLYWGKRSGISLQMVTSFTDGTKVQIEQALVANGLGTGIAKDGLLGTAAEDLQEGAEVLAAEAKRLGKPIADYLLSAKSPPGVFITAEHDERQKDALAYFKMGKGPFYTLLQPYHLCHLEVVKTIRRTLLGEAPLLNNSASPKISVAAVAKRALTPGTVIKKGIGSFDVRGIAVDIAANPNHIPIGLLSYAVVKEHIEPGQILQFRDVDIPDSLASLAWQDIMKKN